mgnify:CR=1 FL=1|tara:strand:- start:1746 stop:2213 length:468 start_codon:yes stop_codon:yes gene_type:complete
MDDIIKELFGNLVGCKICIYFLKFRRKMKKVKKVFNDKELNDIVEYWFDEFPEGPVSILDIGGSTNTDNYKEALNYSFPRFFEKREYRNWSSVARDISHNLNNFEWNWSENSDICFDFGEQHPAEHFKGKDDVEILREIIDRSLRRYVISMCLVQ